MMSKMTEQRTFATLAAMLLCVCAVVGCSREESNPAAEVAPASPDSYMNDPSFTESLKAQSIVRSSIMKRHDQARKQYEAMKAKSPDSDETRAMKAKLDAIEEEFQENRRKTQQIVRERLRQVKQGKQK